jgi:hypothetical protein
MGDHFSIVHFIDMVPGKDQNEIGSLVLENVHILVNGIRCSLIPFFVDPLLGRDHFNELTQRSAQDAPTELDMAMKGGGFVLGQRVDSANIGVEAVGEAKIDDPVNGTEGNRGLGPISSERIESLAPAACKDDG